MNKKFEIKPVEQGIQRVPAKKVIVRPTKPTIRHKKHVSEILEDGYYILSQEMSKLKAKVDQGYPLDREDSQKLSRYIKSLTESAKEEREQEKHGSAEKLDEEQLREKALEAMKVLGIEVEDEEGEKL